MPDINTERILNGTFHKRLVRGYDKLKSSELTNESAMEYQEIYKDESLSNILSESELIFKEPLLGLDFYKEVMTSDMIPLHRYPDEMDKLNRHMALYGELMSEEQHEKYDSLISDVKSIMESRKNEISYSLRDHDSLTESMINEMCNDLYANKRSASVDTFFTVAPIEEQVLYGYYLLPRVDSNRLSSLLYKEMVMTESCETNIEKYVRTSKANVISTYLLEDTAIIRDLKKNPNANLRMIVEESRTENFRSVVDEIFTEHVQDYDPFYSSPENAVMRMFEDDEFYESMQDDFLTTRIVNAAKAKAVLESVLDIVYTEYVNSKDDSQPTGCKIVNELFNSDMTMKEAVDTLVEKVAMMDQIIDIALEDTETEDGDSQSFFEYTRRGEATPTIRKTAGNLREEPYAPSNNKKKSADDSSDDDDEDDEDDEDYEEPKKSSDKKTQSKTSAKENDDKEALEKDVEESPKSNKKPELQKQSMTRKIQNKAIDMDVKMQKRSAALKQSATEVKNAAKAVLRLPANIVKSLKTGIEEWNTMSEEKRKEKILKPGYRTKIFKSLKTAIVYGAIWEYKKYMVIVTFICKHTILHPFFKASAERTKRLRNELTAELETEIAVTEEKINDASANGDQKQKYELIRIKKKLEAEKVRVSTNSKYI